MSAADVRIVQFPETRVAAVEHRGSPDLEHASALKLVQWRLLNRVSPSETHRTYGVHYTDPRTAPPDQHRVDFCISFEGDVAPNEQGVIVKTLPACRCAVARHLGSRTHNTTAVWLWDEWLPRSGEAASGLPMIFHYVNVGPKIDEREMITDVCLPLR